jgi:YidC/Oxa1 family membrane protein insertase
MTGFLGVPVDAAYHLVSALTGVLTPVLGGLAAVAGIIAFTMAVRLFIMPLSYRAMRGQAAQARLAPQLVTLRQRYGKQPERLQREMTALYKREGTSMFAGFLPILAQWPFLSVMYLLFRSPNVAGGPNKLLTHDLLGVPLGSHWLGGPGIVSAQGAVFVGVFALLAGLAWLSARLGRRQALVPQLAAPVPAQAPAKRSAQAPAKRSAQAPAKRQAKKPANTSAPARSKAAAKTPAQAAGQGTAGAPQAAGALGVLGKVLPYVTVVIAAFAPLAGGIYLVTSTGWSLAERRVLMRSASGANRQGPGRNGPDRNRSDRNRPHRNGATGKAAAGK